MEITHLDAEIARQWAEVSRLEALREAVAGLGAGSPQAAVVEHALRCWSGDAGKAWAWLVRPHHVFRGRSPLETILAGEHLAVDEEISRIEHGICL